MDQVHTSGNANKRLCPSGNLSILLCPILFPSLDFRFRSVFTLEKSDMITHARLSSPYMVLRQSDCHLNHRFICQLITFKNITPAHCANLKQLLRIICLLVLVRKTWQCVSPLNCVLVRSDASQNTI